MKPNHKNPHIPVAIANAGGPVSTARKTGAKNYQTVQQWDKAGNVPAEYAVALEEASGISRSLLCKQWRTVWPELAPPPAVQAVEAGHAQEAV